MKPARKNAALYVDLSSDGKVLTPDRVKVLATSEIVGLEWFFHQYHGLLEILEDDVAWSRFAEAVRNSFSSHNSLDTHDGEGVAPAPGT